VVGLVDGSWSGFSDLLISRAVLRLSAAEDVAGDGEAAFDEGPVGGGLLRRFRDFDVAGVFRADGESILSGCI
jgi:hypothetical protein